MRVCAVADIHGEEEELIRRVRECDVLLIGGDISPAREPHDFETQQKWFKYSWVRTLEKLLKKAKRIVFVAGNHDTYLYDMFRFKNNLEIDKIIPSGVNYLCDSFVVIGGKVIYGSPWCNLPGFASEGPPVWNFARNEQLLYPTFASMPHNTHILLTHGPAKDYCDVIEDVDTRLYLADLTGAKKKHLGSNSLLRAIKNVKPRYVISGHIHSAHYGFVDKVYKNDAGENIGVTSFSNVSLVGEDYRPYNREIFSFDIDS